MQNLEADWSHPPVLDNQPMLYIFRKNTIQTFGGTRDWSNNDTLSEMNWGTRASEFLYSDTAIYTEAFYNYATWDKISYTLSSDGKKLTYGRDKLEKFDVEPWTKDDLLGSWYIGYSDNIITMYTFKENSFVIQTYKDGIPNNDYTHANMDITLTDEHFTGRLNFNGYGFEQAVTTCYYYMINDKLLLSNGRILIKFDD